MYRIPGVLSATTARPGSAVPALRPTRDPPPGRDRDDLVVRRLRSAGQDLQAALGLMADHPASAQISHALAELDQAIRDIQEFCPEIGEGGA